MGSEEMNLVSSQRMETALNSQRVYQAEHLQYRCPPSAVNQRRGGPDSARKTARPVGVGGFVESGGRFLPQQRDFRGGIYNPDDLDSDSRRGGSVNMNVNMSMNMNMNMNMNSNTGGLQMRGLVGRNTRTANQQDWNERVAVMGGEGSAGSPSEDDDDDDEDDDDGDGEMDGEVDGMVSNETANTNSNSNNATSNNNVQGTLEGGFQKGEGGIPKSGMQNQHHASLGMFLSPPFLNSFPSSGASMLDGSSAAQNGGAFYRDGLVKESRDNNNSTAANTASSLHEHHQPRIPSMHHNEGALPVGSVPDTDNYYTQLLQSTPPLAHKDAGVDEGGALAEKKGTVVGTESPETSLRTILSDPFTGALMDDATILSCGHSFGSAGLQQVLDMRSCLSCGQQVTNDSVAPNHALRAAVQAYRREEEFQSMSSKSAKRRRDKFEQGLDKVGFSDTVLMDCSRGKGVQFPFVVNDRVVIKGNKRTPERFVGREAVITTQCLNGWYVVKTLDNAESVKLQYRSLLKVGEHQSSNEISQKALGPSWL